MTTKLDPLCMQKFTTYLTDAQIYWLRSTALKRSHKDQRRITAAEVLRELIDQARQAEE